MHVLQINRSRAAKGFVIRKIQKGAMSFFFLSMKKTNINETGLLTKQISKPHPKMRIYKVC